MLPIPSAPFPTCLPGCLFRTSQAGHSTQPKTPIPSQRKKNFAATLQARIGHLPKGRRIEVWFQDGEA